MLEEGSAPLRGVVYKQSSGILTCTAPAPDLVNDFAFMHELNFSTFLMKRYLLDTRNNIYVKRFASLPVVLNGGDIA